MNDSRRLPEGRLARLGKMASLGARTGASMLSRRGSEGAARHAAEVLGTMRGLAAKVGQIASYVDGFVPEANREHYEAALGQLRAMTATSPFPGIRAILEEDLGAPIDRLFSTFDEVPFASASIGQVHRATMEDGRIVAVKIQHPGIARAMESDLASAAMLEPIAHLAQGGKVDSKQVLGELRTRIREELDYRLEAERQEAFRGFHAGDPTIRIPGVVSCRSGPRVLTSDYAQGTTLEQAGTGSEAARRAWAETLWRFVFKGNLVGKMFNADPHPGNYLFGEPGVVTFLDFGCVEILPPERNRHARGLHNAALRRDEEAFALYARQLLETRGGAWEPIAVGYSRRCFEPLFASPYRITRPFAGELVTRLREISVSVRKLPRSEKVTVPRGMIFMNRLQCGFYSVLARLDVEVDYAAVERKFLGEASILE